MPENLLYLQAYSLVADQWIVSAHGLKIGIRLGSIKHALDILEYTDPEDRLLMTEILQSMGSKVAKSQNEKLMEDK